MRFDPCDTHVMLSSGLHIHVLETEYIGALPAHINIQEGREGGRKTHSCLEAGGEVQWQIMSLLA